MNKSSLYLPDTNTVLRYLLQDHPELSRTSTEFWERIRSGVSRAVITEGVLLECVYVLQRFYSVPRRKITESLSALLSYKGVAHTDAELLEQSLTLYGSCSLDFVECMLAVRHLQGDGILFSFDEKLNNMVSQERV
ncbi:MAG TPA: PIN domain-containing protein [Treponemataceae bacterium]|nr:PIN domain-containing protein [Treponemataceae bacterium]